MTTISIVTPFLNGLDLLQDYAATVAGADQVVTVDNGSDEPTANALANAGGTYIRNEENKGFAAANNQGYAAATGDIVIFLNSDVAPAGPWLKMVAADVRDGALYGPSLQYQLVAGRHLPYIEGWCLAATKATWARLVATTVRLNGPWEEALFPGPYWEDNLLCLEALALNIPLVQTAWPVQHKGGRTAGPILNHARSFADNERTFTDRVLAAFSDTPLSYTPVYVRYMQEVGTQSDIQHHLPLLYSLARGNVVELGTRSGVSTAALLAGVEQRGGTVTSIDIDDCSALYAGHPQWRFVQGDSRAAEYDGAVDLLLIDSEHAYEVTQAELAAWHPRLRAGSVILLHDTETFPGVLRAAREYAAAHGYALTNVRPCNGMALVEVAG